MKSKALIAAIVAIVFTAGMALVYTSTGAAGKRMATLTNVKGTVLVKAAGSAEWVEGTDKMVINEGDEIKTRGGSSAIIKMDDGSMLKVGPLAAMKVDKLAKSGQNNQTSMGIEVGKTWNRVNRMTSDSSFDVKTPTAVAGVRGTYFSSEVEKTTDSTFDVFDGQIEVSSSSDPSSAVVVGENQRTQVSPGKTPTSPSTIPADEAEAGKGGFSDAEATMATYDLQISVSPQVVTPGQKATVSVQVFKNGQPDRTQYTLKLSLSGSATFVESGSSEIETTTNDQGAASLEITSSAKETVTVSAELRVKVPKN